MSPVLGPPPAGLFITRALKTIRSFIALPPGLFVGLFTVGLLAGLCPPLHADDPAQRISESERSSGDGSLAAGTPATATPASGPHFRLPGLADRPDYTGVVFHRCEDGATCIMTLPGVQPIFGNQVPVHLADVEAPRLHGQCAREASLAREARELIAKKLEQSRSIELYNTSRPDSFKLVGRLVVDGADLSQLLLDRGLALPADASADHHPWCDQ